MTLELISSNRCPFVQRSIVALEHKQVPYKLTILDPYDPPEWFSEISPLGKVPVLRIPSDGNGSDEVLFESAVINEYLDETTPGQLHPEDPLERAKNRAWIEFGGGCLSNTFKLMTVETQEEFDGVLDELRTALKRIEGVIDDTGPYFNGADFALVDAAYAPLFIRMSILKEMIGVDVAAGIPKVARWQDALMSMDAVAKARFPGLSDRFRELMQDRQSHALGMLQKAS